MIASGYGGHEITALPHKSISFLAWCKRFHGSLRANNLFNLRYNVDNGLPVRSKSVLDVGLPFLEAGIFAFRQNMIHELTKGGGERCIGRAKLKLLVFSPEQQTGVGTVEPGA